MFILLSFLFFYLQWSNPIDILAKNNNKELELYPPQGYELNRLIHLTDIEVLTKYAQERSCHSNEIFFPVVVEAKDGNLHVLPGVLVSSHFYFIHVITKHIFTSTIQYFVCYHYTHFFQEMTSTQQM